MQKNFKKIWYAILIIISSIYVSINFKYIGNFDHINVHEFIFILWVILIVLPLFSELEILGVKFKKELNETKSDIIKYINSTMVNLENKVVSTTNVNLQNPFIERPEILNELKDHLTDEINKHFDSKSTGIADENHLLETGVQDTGDNSFNVDCFKMRFEIEQMIKNNRLKFSNSTNNLNAVLSELLRFKVINHEKYKLITDVLAILNRGIHGEDISDDYISFVKDVYPVIFKYLNELLPEAVKKYNFICACPRCNAVGPSIYQNVCMNCGYVSGD